MIIALHVLIGLLILLVAVRAHHWWQWAALATFTVTYCWPRMDARVRTAILVVSWCVLLVGGVEAAYLAFPLFFLFVFTTGPVHSAFLCAATTVCAIGASIWHSGWSVGAMAGPIVGAVVAWVLGRGLMLLIGEVGAKERALDDLVAARGGDLGLPRSRSAAGADQVGQRDS